MMFCGLNFSYKGEKEFWLLIMKKNSKTFETTMRRSIKDEILCRF